MLQNLAVQANNQVGPPNIGGNGAGGNNGNNPGAAGVAGANGNNNNQQGQNSNEYNELLYAHLLDADGNRLTYTHFTAKVILILND